LAAANPSDDGTHDPEEARDALQDGPAPRRAGVRAATVTGAVATAGAPGAALLCGYAADLVLGDPRRWHPVAGFGRAALLLERGAYAPTRMRGAMFAAALVAAPALAAEALARGVAGGRLGGSRRTGRSGRVRRSTVLAVLTWAALGGRSLTREALNVSDLVERNELDEARRALRALCGRDAAALDGPELCRAAVESVAENTGDAVVGALLWGAVAGPAGVAAYRAANTLDAMVGHRSEHYAQFGWAAARLDDAMSWPAARMAAALACVGAPLVGGSPLAAARIARRDGGAHPSPNSGRAEAAFAGALGVSLGGALAYDGRTESRPRLGDGRTPDVADVHRAARLSLAVGAATVALCAALATVVDRSRSGHVGGAGKVGRAGGSTFTPIAVTV
jgi:adenosylcobinamide-phosphate synthase